MLRFWTNVNVLVITHKEDIGLEKFIVVYDELRKKEQKAKK